MTNTYQTIHAAPTPSHANAYQPVSAEPPMAVAVPDSSFDSGYIAKPDEAASNAVPSYPQPPPATNPSFTPQPRLMHVVVPPGAAPGQALSVQAPDGTVVQVCVIYNSSFSLMTK